MHDSIIDEFPSPPPGINGWPWTEQIPHLGNKKNDIPWPKVSIVTPSYNQAQFIEQTIRSVLLQGYPNLEYIIIDGGSKDGSVGIIKKYEPWLSYWISEPDDGQSAAINKGFRQASGEIIAWLNSDDIYLPNTILNAVNSLEASGASLVYSRCNMVSPDGHQIGLFDPEKQITLRVLLKPWAYNYFLPPQPTVFFRREALVSAGYYLDEEFHYALDYELWLRMSQNHQFHFVDSVWANYLIHPNSKTGLGWRPFVEEIIAAGRRYWYKLGFWDHIECRLFARRFLLARRYLDDAFDAYFAKEFQLAARNFSMALLSNPLYLKNKGVTASFVKSLVKLLFYTP